MSEQLHKVHRKTKEKKANTGDRNPKAFAFANPGKLAKQAARSHDVREKKLHVPLADRLPEEPAPFVVGVVGPPGVGKSTLIKSLVRRYAKVGLSDPRGPITIVTSKRRRLTFLECPSDSLASMIDVAKVVDVLLLMIDGNYGFEMETMEFLNVLSASGMPGNVFGILTHLDLFRKQDALKMQKKRLKHRFWSELYQGAKLFYLSGVVNGRYPDREVLNLSRFLSVMKKPRPLIFRQSHPYCLADRMLDLTPPAQIEEDAKCDRTVALYGYLRGGANFSAEGQSVHIPGIGDLKVVDIEPLPDPCPTPYLEQALEKAAGTKKRRRLNDKQKVIYAPMSDIGGVLVDKDAVYIDVKNPSLAKENGELGEGEQLLVGLQGERRLLGETTSNLRLFTNGNSIISAGQDEVQDSGRTSARRARIVERDDNEQDLPDDEAYESAEDDLDDAPEEDEDDLEDMEDDDKAPRDLALSEFQRPSKSKATVEGDLAFADSDSDLGSLSSGDEDGEQELDDAEDFDDEMDDDDDGALRWKDRLLETAKNSAGVKRPYRVAELASLLYNLDIEPSQVVKRWKGEDSTADLSDEEDMEEEDEGDFFLQKKRSDEDQNGDLPVVRPTLQQLRDKWQDTERFENLRRKMGARGLNRTGANAIGGSDDEDGFGDEDDMDGEDQGDGEFEDLENPSNSNKPSESADAIAAEREANAKRKEELKQRFEEEDRAGFLNDKAKNKSLSQPDGEFGEDEWFDAQKALLEKQQSVNKAEFDRLDPLSRVRVEGYKTGTYARIVVDRVPYEFVEGFNPRYPIIIGGLTPTEERYGYVQMRIKRHRWHKRILKTNDPLIISLGWRRFQTTPLYSISDSRTRNRMLKYTPEHMHCFGTFYGPLIAPNTPFCAVQDLSSSNPGFRVAATGVILNVDESVEIVKKLKLTGVPYKIFKNTAFIKEMFGSSLEIAKFEGASIKTVSGVRGQIKRALSKPEGHFRATFEDKILMSDIVFLRAWYPVKPHRYCNMVTNLVNVSGATGEWTGMRLTGAIRASQNIPTPSNRDSAYRPVVRAERHFNPLRVPRKLAADLPFKSQPIKSQPLSGTTYMQKRAVVADKEEKKARALMSQLLTLKKVKDEKRKESKEKHREVYRAKVAENAEKRSEREKREKDEYWRREGKKRKAGGEGGAGGGGGGGGKRRR